MFRMRISFSHFLLWLLGSLFCVSLFSPSLVAAQTSYPSNQEYQGMLDKLLEDQKQQLLRATELQNNITGSTLDVKINPQVPEPGVPVVITIESYITDLYKANISWSLNDTVVLRGVGETAFTFKNGKGGETTKVSINIITNTGEVVKRDLSFTPVGVTVLWEADTYTPPFYKGKAMMVPQANVRIVAIPDTTSTTDASKLVYTWKRDKYINTTASGYGKNVFSFSGPDPLTSTTVTLAVSSLDDMSQSEVKVYLPQKSPFILFYEKDPLLGTLYNKPLGSEFNLTNKELSISAEPYFFSNERGEAQSLKYTWSVNGSVAKNYGREITLRNDAGAKGATLVSLYMKGLTQNYQTSEKKLQINFTEGSLAKPIF